MSRRIIVAAIGGGKQSAIADLAEAFGGLVARAKLILMTAGEPKPEEKDRIVCTTLNGCVKQKGLMISVLPSQGKNACDLDLNERHIVVQTTLSRFERDPITGAAADIVVVFPGEAGTLLELTYASLYRRPFVFLNSRKALQVSLKEGNVLNELQQGRAAAIRAYPFLSPKPEELSDALDRALEQTEWDVSSPAEAVIKVLLAFENGTKVFGETHFRGLPQCPEIKQLFEQQVETLSGLV
jgi:uncharacterized protein (TIGR00725 family)